MALPMAVATRTVLQTKYANAAPMSGFGNCANGIAAPIAVPPSATKTRPATFTVRMSDAMLKSVRYTGDGVFARNVHWLHALVAATSIVASGPMSSSEAKSIA